jgi:tetratricopeptide (TPR) repeat protein
MKTQIKSLFAAVTLLLSSSVLADVLADIKPLQDRWAEVNYALAEDDREKAFAELLATADKVVSSNPDKAEALIWRGIIKSSYANAKGGLGALSVAEGSKADLEQAITLDPTALQGSAYTSLGVLYSKVPGWPIGFGDSKKAKELLLKALEQNPQGIDPNYFYADYLAGKRDWAQALRYLEIAKAAAPRPGRESADAGRQQEIANLLAKVQKKLKK